MNGAKSSIKKNRSREYIKSYKKYIDFKVFSYGKINSKLIKESKYNAIET